MVRAWEVLYGDGSNLYQAFRKNIPDLEFTSQYLVEYGNRIKGFKLGYATAIDKRAWLDVVKSDPSRMIRVGEYPGIVTEVPISSLNPLHDVPRAATPSGHIEGIQDGIETNGYLINRDIDGNGGPASATRLPNGDLLIGGGHHRIEAMNRLGEETIPTQVFDHSTTDPERLAYHLGIARTTKKYIGYIPNLTATQKATVNNRLILWREHNPDQVRSIFEY